MARAKNTSRAEARKRTRDQQRAEIAELTDEELIHDEPADEQPARRPSLFQMPPIRDDIRALPSVFRTRRLVWLPFILVVVGFFLQLIEYGVPAELGQWFQLYISLFFLPPPSGLFVFFIGGFLAPRASWLVGLILGVLNGLLFTIAILATWPVDQPRPDLLSSVVSTTLQSAIVGSFAGGFAAWYRNFLRNMQESGNKRRAEKEAQAVARRRTERQEARRVLKGRS